MDIKIYFKISPPQLNKINSHSQKDTHRTVCPFNPATPTRAPWFRPPRPDSSTTDTTSDTPSSEFPPRLPSARDSATLSYSLYSSYHYSLH